MRTRLVRTVAVLVVAVLVAGCGGGKGSDDGASGRDGDGAGAGEPVRGGSLTYGIEAETGGGFCLQEAQLAISGILVARAVYDTLTAPNDEGEYVPYLAESVEPNEDYTEWTITVRDGVTFHDGSDLTATVVKNNLDAYRGAEGDHARSPLLFLFVLDNIDTVTADDAARTVTVTTKVPWVAFPAFLFSSGRLGISAQAQLDDADTCDRRLIGTGPFVLEDPSDWVEGREMRLAKNPDYWQVAPDGEPYPYLDGLVFQPVVESEQRVNALESGDLDVAHFSTSDDILAVRDLTEAGTLDSYESTVNAEVEFLLLNTERPPFDDERIRRAIALAFDPEDYKEQINDGILDIATGVFAPGSPGYVDDTGYPQGPDIAEATRLVEEYEAENGAIRPIDYMANPSQASQDLAVYVQQTLGQIGLTLEQRTVQQDAEIDTVIGGDYDIDAFRNYPGGDPDELYVWFHSGSPVNFGRITDDEVDRLLEQGRSDPDPEVRTQAYQDFNRRLGSGAFHTFFNFATWVVASQPGVHGYDPDTSPPLPDGGGTFDAGLAVGHPLHGLWVDE